MSRLLNMVTRGVLRSSAATGGFFRSLTVSAAADTPDDVDHFEVHGLASRPSAGAQALLFAAGGNAEHLVALIAGSSGLSLAEGETAVYNEHGWSMQLKEDSIDFVFDGEVKMRIEENTITLGVPGSPTLLAVGRNTDPAEPTIAATSIKVFAE